MKYEGQCFFSPFGIGRRGRESVQWNVKIVMWECTIHLSNLKRQYQLDKKILTRLDKEGTFRPCKYSRPGFMLGLVKKKSDVEESESAAVRRRRQSRMPTRMITILRVTQRVQFSILPSPPMYVAVHEINFIY